MGILYENLLKVEWQQVVMWVIGGLLIYLAIKKDMEPALLLPMGFGAILVNLPMSGAITSFEAATDRLSLLFRFGIATRYPAPCLYGIRAM